MFTDRYSVRHTLSVPAAAEVEKLRREIARRFRVYAALLSPPHVTLRYDFETRRTDRAKLALKDFATREQSFVVPVIGFGSFGQEVWFLEPEQTAELRALHNRVAETVRTATGLTDDGEWSANPHFHITLAFRDVTPQKHRLIGEFLRDRSLPIVEFTVDSITLCRKSLGGLWFRAYNLPFEV